MHPKTILAAVAASGSAVAFAQEVEVLISRPSKSNDHAGSFVGYGVVRRNTCMNPEDNMGKVVKGSQFHVRTIPSPDL